MPYATIDQAVEYYPAAAGGPDLRVEDVLKDCSNQIDRLSPEDEPAYALLSPITASATTIPVAELSDYHPRGLLVIDDERITYSGRSGEAGAGNLTGCKRGTYNSTAAAHAAEAAVILMPLDYADKRRRCELRLFEYLFETGGTIMKDQLHAVSTTDYRSTRTVTRMIKQIMGRAKRKNVRLV